MLTLIENGEIYAPEPLGRRSLLMVEDGRPCVRERFLASSGRNHALVGDRQ